jgi:serine protease inhibitor ecotin
MAFTMACPNFKKRLKMVSRPLGVKKVMLALGNFKKRLKMVSRPLGVKKVMLALGR